MKRTFVATMLIALFCSPFQATADVLLIDAISEAAPNTTEGLARPSRGMNMDSVRSKFGEPDKAHPQVGEPPITRWDYAGYSVFFEHDLVLNTVVHRQ